jgi:hypothetical protein
MAMNPRTHRLEELHTDEAEKAAGAKGWKIFKVGEKVTVNGTDFSVTEISPTKLTLRPYGLTMLKAGERETIQGPLQRLEDGEIVCGTFVRDSHPSTA